MPTGLASVQPREGAEAQRFQPRLPNHLVISGHQMKKIEMRKILKIMRPGWEKMVVLRPRSSASYPVVPRARCRLATRLGQGVNGIKCRSSRFQISGQGMAPLFPGLPLWRINHGPGNGCISEIRSIGPDIKNSDVGRPLHTVTESTTNTSSEWNMEPNSKRKTVKESTSK